jgi:hypothetical protein
MGVLIAARSPNALVALPLSSGIGRRCPRMAARYRCFLASGPDTVTPCSDITLLEIEVCLFPFFPDDHGLCSA